MFVVIAYDIADDDHRGRLARLLEGYGTRVQKSVFECSLQASDLSELMGQALSLIDRAQDSIRLYRLCGACVRKAESWGALPTSMTCEYRIV